MKKTLIRNNLNYSNKLADFFVDTNCISCINNP